MDIQSAARQHPVPQNVMEVEFKLIGDLTIRQFTYLLVFGILLALTMYSELPAVFKLPLAGLFLFMGLGFAFFPLNDITLDKWFVNYIKAILKPRNRVWKHTKNTPYYFTFTATQSADPTKYYDKKTVKQKMSLEELLNTDKPKSINFTSEEDLENKEKEFFNKLGLKHQVENTKPVAKQVVDEPTIQVEPVKQTGTSDSFFVIPTQSESQKLKELIKEEHEDKQGFSSVAISKENKEPLPTKPIMPMGGEKIIEYTPPVEEKKDEREKNVEENAQTQTQTPEIPIEDTLKVEELKVEPVIEEKTITHEKQELIDYQKNIKELNLLKQRLLRELEQNKYRVLDGKEEEVKQIRVKEIREDLEKENKDLKEKLKKMANQQVINQEKSGIERSPFFASFLLKIKGEKEEPKQEETQVKDENGEFIGTIEEPTDADTLRTRIKGKDHNQKTFKLKGSTIDNNGNVVPDVVVIVKNASGEAVRALKSNSLGEFESSTELAISNYSVEGTKEQYKFEQVNIKASESFNGLVKLVGIKE